ncbi:F-box domain-containing protein [Pseudohyphozyma bogoriensis]|nr:F-box domain-containing protein [Pseudohyphozyma bogoriensis]
MPPLPPEIILHILEHLDDHSLASCRRISKDFAALAALPSLWLPRIERRWRYGTRFAVDSDPFGFYRDRDQLDVRAVEIVKGLAAGRAERIPPLNELRLLGDDVLNALCKEAALLRDEDEDMWLTRRYYAAQGSDAILRDASLRTWRNIAALDDASAGPDELMRSFEDGVAAFSGFRSWTSEMVSDMYDQHLPALIAACEPALAKIDTPIPFITAIVHATMDLMREVGIKSASPLDYHDLGNHYLSVVWTRAMEPDVVAQKGTLPMTMVSIFTSFIRRLPAAYNIQARPVGFPGNVISCVARRDAVRGEEDWVYVDIFRGSILQMDDLHRMLRDIGMAPDPTYFAPASPSAMCQRVANNIVHSATTQNPGTESISGALYAAAHALFILSPVGRAQHSRWLSSLIQAEYQFDVELLNNIALSSPPTTRKDLLLLAQSIKFEDSEEPTPKTRPESVTIPVGTIFHHRRHGYDGVVRGWDVTCLASEQWILQMRVDDLPGGRNQPFYHILAADGSRRYVAQENIDASAPVSIETIENLLADNEVGKWFRTLDDVRGRRCFVPSAQLEAEFPEL